MRRRTGFTLIELLVAIALIVMILGVLASAFSVGLDSFGRLKAIGDMSERLRVAAQLIREDLAANHFEGDYRLSDPGFGGGARYPREGFFYIKQFAPSVPEGTADGTISWRSPAVNATTSAASSHVLYMTVRRKGNRDRDFFAAPLPSGAQLLNLPDETSAFPPQSLATGSILAPDARMQDPNRVFYRSQWAEVAYFLRPLPTNDTITALGTPLFALQRVVRVLVSPENRRFASIARSQQDLYYGMSFYPPSPDGAAFTFLTPQDGAMDLAIKRRSLNFNQEPTNPAAAHLPGWSDPAGNSDTRFLLLPDVISFTVQVVRVPSFAGAGPAFGYPVASNGTVDFVDLNVGYPYNWYDSASSRTGLIAIRITLRVWDVRSHQTRQISIIQDL